MVARKRAVRTRPRPQPEKPPLTRERILDVALAAVDRHGLGALTMRSLGRELGVEAMSLYHHFPDKARLLEGVADRVLAGIDDTDDRADWRAGLCDAGQAFWRALQAHPNAIPLMLATPLADQPNARRLTEGALRMFGRAGLRPAEGHRAFRVFQAFILGAALMIRAQPTAADVARQIRELDRSGEELPLLRSALGDRRILDREPDFEAGLELLLGAWGNRAGRKKPTPRRGH